jgi:hypothetical protein
MSFDDRDSDDEIIRVYLSFVPTNNSHFIGITEKQIPTDERNEDHSCETKPSTNISPRMSSDAQCTRPTRRPFVVGDTCNVFNSIVNEKIPDPYFPKLF